MRTMLCSLSSYAPTRAPRDHGISAAHPDKPLIISPLGASRLRVFLGGRSFGFSATISARSLDLAAGRRSMQLVRYSQSAPPERNYRAHPRSVPTERIHKTLLQTRPASEAKPWR